jgi:hypothetical protein
MKNKTLKKYDNEIDLYYNVRNLFIQLLKPKKLKEYKLYEAYSHIFINIIFLKCIYEEKTEKFIKDFLKKYKKKMNMNINNI